jgi:carbamoylphosphate synthase large subunit
VNVLVTGVGSVVGRAVAAYVRDRGMRVVGFDAQTVDDVVDEFHLVTRGNGRRFLDEILQCLDGERPFLMIPTGTEDLRAASMVRNTMHEKGVRVFVSEIAMIDLTEDKLRTAMLLRTLGIPAPRTISLVESGVAASAGGHLGYPLLAKPRYRTAGRGVMVYRDPLETEKEQRMDVVFQEFMPGEECEINLFAYPAGFVQSVVVLQRTMIKNGMVRNPRGVRRVIRRDMAELGIRTVRALGLEGPICIDARRDVHGAPRILGIKVGIGENITSASEIMESLLTAASEESRVPQDANGSHVS